MPKLTFRVGKAYDSDGGGIEPVFPFVLILLAQEAAESWQNLGWLKTTFWDGAGDRTQAALSKIDPVLNFSYTEKNKK